MPNKELDKALKLVSRFANTISSSMSLHELAINVQAVLDSFIDVEYDAIYFFSDEKRSLELIYAKNFTEEERAEAERTAMDRHPGQVYKSKKPLLIPDTSKNKDSKSSKRSFVVNSRLFMPILIEDQCVGTFGLGSSHKNKFTDYDIQILSLVGSMAAMRFIAMKKESQIKAKNKELRSKIEQNKNQLKENTLLIERLKIINDFAVIIQDGKSIDDVVWSVAKNAVAQLGYVDCVIYLLDEKGEYLIQRATHGNKNPKSRDILDPIKIKIGEGIVGTVAATGIGEIIDDTSKDKRYILDDTPRLSEITVPLIHNSRVLGIIDSEHPEKGFFPKDHLDLLNTIASMAATKLVQAKYNDELKMHQAHLEELVDKRTTELVEKSHKIEEQNIKLQNLALFPEHNPNPVVELDFDYNIIYYNKGAKEHLKDTPFFDMDDPERHKYEALLDNTQKGKKTGIYEIKEGFWIKNRHYDMRLYIDNKFKIMRIYLNDVTEIKRIQNELTEALGKVNSQQKELKDSIRYAEHLQKAILPHPKTSKGPKLDSFVFYQPKDIVSGDFYARDDRDGNIIIAAADCTGHGIPGAMLSFVCFNALNSAIRELRIADPAIILNRVRELVIETFEKSERTVNDGMDIAMCTLNLETKELSFAGANTTLYVVRKLDKDCTEKDPANTTHYLRQIKGDSQPIGNYFNMQPFNKTNLSFSSGDIIYIFSDGFADQFGGERDKKFGYRRFRELLFSNKDLPMSEQKSRLQTSFEEWKGEGDQIDDVLVLGIRL